MRMANTPEVRIINSVEVPAELKEAATMMITYLGRSSVNIEWYRPACQDEVHKVEVQRREH